MTALDREAVALINSWAARRMKRKELLTAIDTLSSRPGNLHLSAHLATAVREAGLTRRRFF